MTLSQVPDFSGKDLSGQNLSGQKLRRARIRGANLSNANLDGTDLTGADFSFSNLSGASMIGARLAGSTMVNVRMHEANLASANLVAARIEKSSLIGSNLSYATARMSVLISVDLRYSSLAFVNFSKAQIIKCLINNSVLVETVLKDSSIRDCRGQHADWKPPDDSETEQSRLRDARNCEKCKKIWAKFSNDFCQIHSSKAWKWTTLLRAAETLREEKLIEYRNELRKCSFCFGMVLLPANSRQCSACSQAQAAQDSETRRRYVNRGRGDPYRWWR